MPTKTMSANMCFRQYFEERLCQQNRYFHRDKLYANTTFFVSKNVICRRNCVLSTKLVSRRNTISSEELVIQQNSISLEKLICQRNWVSSRKLECRRNVMPTKRNFIGKNLFRHGDDNDLANAKKLCRHNKATFFGFWPTFFSSVKVKILVVIIATWGEKTPLESEVTRH